MDGQPPVLRLVWCEARADRNARYGTDPGVLFYTHVTDRFTPFHTKVIAANAGEAAHVLDGLLRA